MDAWIKQHLGLAYDAGGEWAQTGEVIVPLLNALVADPYFLLPPPKSLGKEYFSQQWLEDYLQADYVPENVQATLLALTANTIADVVNNSPYHLKRVAICGGGVHNVALLTEVSTCLPNLWVGSTSLLGIDPDYMEAMMLAWLASKTLRQTPLDLTRITGSRKEAIYGVIYAAGIDKRNSIDV